MDEGPSNPRRPANSPVMDFLNGRLKAHMHELREIAELENVFSKDDAGEEINNRIRSKTSVDALVKEYEKISKPLQAALQEELNLIKPIPAHTQIEANPDLFKDLVELIYCWFLFDNKSIKEAKEIMACRKKQRVDCPNMFPDSSDLDSIVMLGGMVASRPLLSCLSHENQVKKCLQHAHLWLTKSEKSITDGGGITYADVKEKVDMIVPERSPVLKFMSHRLASFEGVLKNFEEKGVLIERQKELRSQFEAIIQEHKKMRQSLKTAIQKELELNQPLQPTPPTQVDPELLRDLVELLYWWFNYDEKPIHEVKDIMAYRRIQRLHCLNHGPDTLNDTDLDYIAKLGELVVGRSLLSELSHVDLIVDGRYLQSHAGALGNCFQHAYLWMTNSSESIEDTEITCNYADLRAVLNKIVASDYFTAIPDTPLDVDISAATAAIGTGNYVQVLDPSDNDSEFPIWPETTNVGEDDLVSWEEDE